MQKLTIENFGPIQQAEIQIKDILLFIGPQASGKSTISKAIYFFKSLRDDLFRYILDILNGVEPPPPNDSVANFSRRARDKFLGIYGSVSHFTSMYLHYSYDNGVYIEVVPAAENAAYTNIWLSGRFSQEFKPLVARTVRFKQDAEKRKRDRFLSSSEALTLDAEERAFIQSVEKQKCDHLFVVCDSGDSYFVELKGRHLLEGVTQISSTLDFFAQQIGENRGNIFARIVVTQVSVPKAIQTTLPF